MRTFVAIFALLALGHAAAEAKTKRPSPSQKYEHMVYMDVDEKYQLFWTVSGDLITFEMIVETLGYVGLGWSANGGMKNADIVTAWVDKGGELHIQDRYGTGFVKPQVDKKSDVWPEMGAEKDGYTIIKFSRKLDTCDKEHDRPITTDTMRVIWSFGQTDPASPDGLYYHSTNRGTKRMYMVDVVTVDIPMPKDTFTKDFTVKNFEIPPTDTHYECKIMQLPKLDKKHHVIKFGPIITSRNEGIVHHMILYLCPTTSNAKLAERVGEQVGSDKGCNMKSGCYNSAFGWAIGGEDVSFPEHVGYPIGGPDEPLYSRLEIHYDNPNKTSGIKDSSGIRMYITPTLRQNDVGVLLTAKLTNQIHIIPPQQEAFISRAKCNKKCTDAAFDKAGRDEVKIFGIFPHTHLAGSGVTTRHMRNGVELEWLSKDEHYDFNYQMMNMKKKEVAFKRGDEMLVDCKYNTMDRKKPVTGGLSTREEMCISFVYYYPRIELVSCVSMSTYKSLQEVFTKYTTLGPFYDYKQINATNFLDYVLNEMSWVNAAPWWQNNEINGPFNQLCSFSGKAGDRKYFADQPAINIRRPYKKISKCDIPSAAVGVIPGTLSLVASVVLHIVLTVPCKN